MEDRQRGALLKPQQNQAPTESMKGHQVFPLLFLSLFRPMTASDLLPAHWIEDVPASDESVQRSVVFRTVEGVIYQVESSRDLVTWTSGEKIYGLGHEHVIPLLEVANPPPPDPQSPPIQWVPFSTVSLRIQPSSGLEGGTVLSWPSLDHGGPMIYRIEGNLHQGWDEALLFAEKYDTFYFFIHHPNNAVAPPLENMLLGTTDDAMVATFEAHLADMNQIVAASQARARETPSPAPPSIDSRLFVRIGVDWSEDTDDDGTPDWMEFANEASGLAAGNGEPSPDPMNPDTNENGIPDGEETDSDGDGVADRFDVAPNDDLLNWAKSKEFRFAWFNVDPGPSTQSTYPIQVNDQGAVLFNGSVWEKGIAHTLNQSNGTSLRNCRPLGLSDNRTILGIGEVIFPSDPGEHWSPCLVTWLPNGGNPVPLRFQSKYLYPVFIPVSGAFAFSEISPSDMILNANGEFIAHEATPILNSSPSGDYYTLQVSPTRKKWKLTPNTVYASGQLEAGVDIPGNSAAWVGGDGTIWGTDDEGKLKTGSTVFDVKHDRISQLPGDQQVVFAGYNFINGPFAREAGVIPFPRVFDETWKPSEGLNMLVDFSSSGGFGIGRYNSVWFNGKNWALEKLSPGVPDTMKDDLMNRLIDTTVHGWTLAAGDVEGEYTTHVGMPIRLTQVQSGRGLDDLSLGARKSKFETPAQQAAAKDEFWVMVPAGGEVSVTLGSAASPVSPLEIGGGEITCVPAITTNHSQEIELSALATLAGTEAVLPLKLGGVESVSIPIRAKIMPTRTVNVSIWPLKRPNQGIGNPANNLPTLPTKLEIESHLNDIYRPQINITFNVTIKTESSLVSDPGPQFFIDDPDESYDYLSLNRDDGDINVYILGGYNFLTDIETPETSTYVGFSIPPISSALMSVYDLVYGGNEGKQSWLYTLAHEIGHVMVGEGHPNVLNDPGPAPLSGVDDKLRLMHNGRGLADIEKQARRILVKGEWDEAEEWLILNVDEIE